jgi:hypothetical protein
MGLFLAIAMACALFARAANTLPASVPSPQAAARSRIELAPVPALTSPGGLQVPSIADSPLDAVPAEHLPLPTLEREAQSAGPAETAPPSVDGAFHSAEALAQAVSPSQGPSASPASSQAASAKAFDGTGMRRGAPASAVSVGPDLSLPQTPGLSPSPESEFPGELVGSQGALAVPGSVFGWRPFNEAPDHGFRPVDSLARWILGREDTRFRKGFEDSGSGDRSAARVFFYGEKHSDRGLIEKNMRLLAKDIRAEHGAVVLVESYLGRDLHGSEAVRFLRGRGLDPDRLDLSKGDVTGILVRGWEAPQNYDSSIPYLRRYHMELLSLNLLMHGEARGLGYYADLAKQACRTFQAWRKMRRAIIDGRNRDLDRAMGRELATAARSGASIHVIAGAEHLVDRPLWSDVPLVGSTRLRKSLARLLGGAPYWAGKPPDTALSARGR